MEADTYKGTQNTLLDTSIWHWEGTYCDEFEQWKRIHIPLDVQQMIQAVQLDSNGVINSEDLLVPAGRMHNLQMTIDNEIVSLLIYIDYFSSDRSLLEYRRCKTNIILFHK